MKNSILISLMTLMVIGMSSTESFAGFFRKRPKGTILVDTTRYQVIPKNKYALIDTTYTENCPKSGDPYNVLILTVSKERQLYPTPALHYWNAGGDMIVFLSTDNPVWNELLSIHEIVEAMACIKDGVPHDTIFRFDMDWVQTPGSDIREPGSEPNCPYHKEHEWARTIERMVSDIMGNDWIPYDDEMFKMQIQPEKK